MGSFYCLSYNIASFSVNCFQLFSDRNYLLKIMGDRLCFLCYTKQINITPQRILWRTKL